MATEQEPQRAVDRRFLARIKGEFEVWRREGLVTDEQAEAILSMYVVFSQVYGRLIIVLATLGAILVGLGVILFVASNWQAILGTVKLLLLLATVAATSSLGYWLKYERSFPRVGGSLVFLGTLVFGGSIFLIGQQYHMRVDDPNLLTWWFLGVIPLAYLTRSRTILTLAILAALGMVGYRAGIWLEDAAGESAVLAFFGLYLILGLVLYGLGAIHRSGSGNLNRGISGIAA